MAVSPLLRALYEGRRADAEALAAARADDDLDVFEAAVTGRLGRLAALLAADPELAGAVAPDGFTVLHLPCFFGPPDSVALLLRAGAPVDAVAANPMQVRPLHSAVAGRQTEAVRCLLACGADPDARQQGGWTALHAAAQHGDQAVADLLLACGADPASTNDGGEMPASLAARAGHDPLAARLEILAAGAGRR